ncbi:MAG: hypothetical protein IPL96_16260 [Holophagaceae bacterium]|nr:hypothetical protein [Holophagaceae bacterium]
MKFLTTILALVLAAAPAFSQDKPDTEKRVADLERKLEILSRELEAQKTGAQVPQAAEGGKFGLAPAASKVYETKGGLSIGGYGEVLYENFDAKLEDGTYSPKANTVDFARQILYVGYKFNETFVFNTELEFEHAKTSNSANDGGSVSVEFAYLDVLLNKAFNARAGMLLIPMGFINEIHEPPTYLGAKRPVTETAIIPTTWRENGLGIHGELPGNLSYRFYLVNGLRADRFTKAGIRGGRQNGGSALAESLAYTGRLDWNPLPGATFGVSFYRGNSNQNDQTATLSGEPITTAILEAHGEYRWRGLQARGLYARMTNSEAGVKAATPAAARELGTKQFGGYLEVGYDVLGGRFGRQALLPFVRFERANTQQEVVAGVTADKANDQSLRTVGLVYKPIPQIAFKADLQTIENRARKGRNQVNLGFGYYF